MTVTVAMIETINAYRGMPERVEDLPALAGKLGELRQANLDHHAAMIRLAAEEGADIVGLGELFPGPYFALTELAMWLDLAESAEVGPTVTTMAKLAAELGIVIVAPIYELDAGSGRRFNTAVVIDADGTVLGRYRKSHVPDGSNERASFRETYYYQTSDGMPGVEQKKNLSDNPYFPVFDTAVGRVGVAICYDRHFDGVMAVYGRQKAQLVMVPAVTFGTKSERMWELEFEVDAARHNYFVAGSNRRGAERPWNIEFYGRSWVCGPNGRVPTRRPHRDVVLANVDLTALERVDPSGWNLRRDRREDIYG